MGTGDAPIEAGAKGVGAKGSGAERRLGDFVIEKELGRGGMGVVFRARQESMGRTVALKVLPSIVGMDASAVTRFRQEAEAAGRLSHPGIVPVFAVGEVDGVHYFAMELVDGPPLDKLLEPLKSGMVESLRLSLIEEAQLQDQLPALREPPGLESVGNRYVRSCAGLIMDVAGAMAAAHRSEVIHRDLKPSNILLHPSGRPVVVDFGLARQGLSSGLTQSGDALGTPSYMAPEQAQGRKDLDARVDIYGLGATLYELLTLRPPFEGASPGEIMRQIIDEDPPRLRRLNPRVPADLDTIVHRCLEKDPEDRYASIEALELDLRRFLEGRPVLADSDSTRRRVRSLLRRQRKAVVSAVATLLVVALIIGGVGIVRQRQSAEQGRQALDRGLELLATDASAAIGEFARAQTLLDAARWQQAMAGCAAAAVDRYYGRDEASNERLAEVFDWLPAAVRSELPDRADRVRGIGFLSVDGVTPDQVRIAKLRSDAAPALQPGEFRPHSAAHRLEIGDYAVQLGAAGRQALYTVRVARDQRVKIEAEMLAAGAVPEGFVPVFDVEADPSGAQRPAAGAPRWAIARTEFGFRQLARTVEQIPMELRAEVLGDLDPVGQEPDRAVVGLSFAQARYLAAASGAHLPTWQELEFAGTAGLDASRYPLPWGRGERQWLVADPDRHAHAEAIEHPAEPARSLLGLHHVLGNAAEICAKTTDYGLVAYGGHFQSDGATLRFGAPELRIPLPEPSTVHPKAGLRLARVLPPKIDGEAIERAQRDWSGLDGFVGTSWRHTWTILERGTVRYEQTLRWIADGQRVTKPIDLDSPGFVAVDPSSTRIVDGHGLPVSARWSRPEPDRLRGEFVLDDKLRANQAVRLTTTADLRPVTGLMMDGDAYTFRLPMVATPAGASAYRLVIPVGVRIDAVQPEPAHRFAAADGRATLIWLLPPDALHTAAVAVRFRYDGLLATRWPERHRVEQVVATFFECLRRRSSTLSVLADDFTWLPEGIGKATVAANQTLPELRSPRIRDVTTVGEVTLVDLAVDWRPVDAERSVASWPMQLFLRQPAPGLPWQALRLQPRSRADTGAMDGRTYTNADLRVAFEPDTSFSISREQVFVPSMQVGVRLGPGLVLHAFGMRTGADERADDETLMTKLTSGASAMLGRRPQSTRIRMRRGRERLEPVRAEGLQVQVAADEWHAVLWTLFRAGSRAFVLQCRAAGETAAAARQNLAENEFRFAEIAARLRVADT